MMRSSTFINVPVQVTVTEDGYVQVVIRGFSVVQPVGRPRAEYLQSLLAKEAEKCPNSN